MAKATGAALTVHRVMAVMDSLVVCVFFFFLKYINYLMMVGV